MINILSLGAGVQSSAMALMAAKGELTPMPDAAIFSDVGAEPQSVYDYLEYLEKQLPFPVHVVMEKEGLLKDVEKGIAGGRCSNPPFHTETGILMRTCTVDFKIVPIIRKTKEIAGWKGRKPKEPIVDTWIGISLDEIQRMKESREPWINHRFPLIEKRMHRYQCKKWIEDNGFRQPPRSACWFCPYHSNKEWRRLKDEEPEEFQKAVELDKRIRDGVYKTTQKLFLHGSRMPLDEVDLSTDVEKGQNEFGFVQECDGMCGM
jgi:hypothetical protein